MWKTITERKKWRKKKKTRHVLRRRSVRSYASPVTLKNERIAKGNGKTIRRNTTPDRNMVATMLTIARLSKKRTQNKKMAKKSPQLDQIIIGGMLRVWRVYRKWTQWEMEARKKTEIGPDSIRCWWVHAAPDVSLRKDRRRKRNEKKPKNMTLDQI